MAEEPEGTETPETEGANTDVAPEGTAPVATQPSGESKEVADDLRNLLKQMQDGNEYMIQVLSDKLDMTKKELDDFRKWAMENPVEEVTPPAPPIVPAVAGSSGNDTSPATGGEDTGGSSGGSATDSPAPVAKPNWLKRIW